MRFCVLILLLLPVYVSAFSFFIKYRFEGMITGADSTAAIAIDRNAPERKISPEPLTARTSESYVHEGTMYNQKPSCISFLVHGEVRDRYCASRTPGILGSRIEMRNVFDSTHTVVGAWKRGKLHLSNLDFEAERYRLNPALLAFDSAFIERVPFEDSTVLVFRLVESRNTVKRISLYYPGRYWPVSRDAVPVDSGRIFLKLRDFPPLMEREMPSTLTFTLHSRSGGRRSISIRIH